MNKPLLALLLLTTTAAAQLPDQSADRHMGVATCAASQCHGSAVPRSGSAVQQNEYVTWTRDDPHSGAYQTLASEESRAIARRLGLASATTAGICLDCHADNVPAARRGEQFQLSDGVGCESCHGGAERWLSTHYNTPTVDHAANIAAGLYATEDPAARAELCLSCHLGNENKFATHRIMAAGHPRLVFELDTFTELWNNAGRQPHYLVDDDYRQRKDAHGHVYTWAQGVVAEARQRMALAQSPRLGANGLFPELGLYDCHACHRSMQSVQWQRLPRHGNAAPGTPFLTDAALVMTLALARAIDGSIAEDLENALIALHVSGSRNAAAVRTAAAGIDRQLDRLAPKLTPATLAAREERILREILATGAEGNFLDYASAEQAFMAVQMLAYELGDPRLRAELDTLGDALEDDERYRPARFRQLLAALAN